MLVFCDFSCAVGGHSYDILYAVVKAALLSPRYQCLFPSPYYREDGESICDMGTIPAELTSHPSYQVLPSDCSIPLRYAWDSYIWTNKVLDS